MKAQAQAASAMFGVQDASVEREALRLAQERMALVEPQCRGITRMLLRSKDAELTIDTLDEQRLAHELGYI